MRLISGARVVVVSDTHMPRMAKQLPAALREALAEADLVIHAGDWVTTAAVGELQAYAPVVGVAGNNDDADIRQRFPAALLVDFGGIRLGVAHGHEGRGANTVSRAVNAFADEDMDAIIFGHSHIPVLERRQGVLVFNPGSPTDKRRQPRYSFGVLHLGDGISAKHEFFEEKV